MAPDFDIALEDAVSRQDDPTNPDAGDVDPLFANPHVTAGGRLAAAAAIPAVYRGEGQPVGDEDNVW